MLLIVYKATFLKKNKSEVFTMACLVEALCFVRATSYTSLQSYVSSRYRTNNRSRNSDC